LEHQSNSGECVPGTFAAESELLAMAAAVRAAGRGLVQAVPGGVLGGVTIAESGGRLGQETELLARVACEAGVPIVFTLMQAHDEPYAFRDALKLSGEVNRKGAALYPMVAPRSPGLFSGWKSHHVFQRRETYLRLASLSWGERLAALRCPEVRMAILRDRDIPAANDSLMSNFHLTMRRLLPDQFVVDDHSWEPERPGSISARALRMGISVEECAYDVLMQRDGHGQLVSLHRNYAEGNYDAVHEMLAHPTSLCGLSDAGAHARVICDASNPTFMLTFWGRDRQRGPRFPLEFLVKKLSFDNARAFGFADRGRLATGLRADINIIDIDALKLEPATIVADLPCGGERFLQPAKGYKATIVNGVVTRRDDLPTGALPGRLVR
jgi:N-acyl-D-amino-acid deacylase